MDTFRNLLSQISDEHARDKALFYAEQYLGDRIDTNQCLCVPHAIIHGFPKDQTTEGEAYWEEILEYELGIDDWPN
jgi:hypothetical protein